MVSETTGSLAATPCPVMIRTHLHELRSICHGPKQTVPKAAAQKRDPADDQEKEHVLEHAFCADLLVAWDLDARHCVCGAAS